jgi:hypothetical protein
LLIYNQQNAPVDGAEAGLRALGSTWEWLDNSSADGVSASEASAGICTGTGASTGVLKTVTATVPAIRVDDQPAGARRSLRKTFFNSVVAAYTGWNDSRNDGTKAVLLGCRSTGTGSKEGGGDGGGGGGGGGGGDGGGGLEPESARYLDPAAMEAATRLMQEKCVAFPWQAGDVLILDNRTTMHSRRPYEGPRRILAALARDPMR